MKSGKALKKREITPESGAVDTYGRWRAEQLGFGGGAVSPPAGYGTESRSKKCVSKMKIFLIASRSSGGASRERF